MAAIKTAGELRGFLAEVLQGIRSGAVDVEEANAIAKVAAQINNSLAVEVSTALQLQKMGKDQPAAGSMLIGSRSSMAIEEAPETRGIWCDQCEGNVSLAEASGCKSPYCKAKQ